MVHRSHAQHTRAVPEKKRESCVCKFNKYLLTHTSPSCGWERRTEACLKPSIPYLNHIKTSSTIASTSSAGHHRPYLWLAKSTAKLTGTRVPHQNEFIKNNVKSCRCSSTCAGLLRRVASRIDHRFPWYRRFLGASQHAPQKLSQPSTCEAACGVLPPWVFVYPGIAESCSLPLPSVVCACVLSYLASTALTA